MAASVTHLVPKSRFLTRSASLDTPAISSLPQPPDPPPCGSRTNSHIQQTWPNQNDALRIGLDATLTAAKLSKNKAAEPYRLAAAILRQQPVWTEADPSDPQTAEAACSVYLETASSHKRVACVRGEYTSRRRRVQATRVGILKNFTQRLSTPQADFARQLSTQTDPPLRQTCRDQKFLIHFRVETTGVEPATPALQRQCSPN